MTLAEYRAAEREGRVIHLFGDVNRDFLQDFRTKMAEFHKDPARDEVVVTLSSIGGEWSIGHCLYNDLLVYGSQNKLWIVCQGSVRSLGIDVMMAAPKDHRVAFELSEFYLHRHSFSYENKLKSSTIEQHRYQLKEYEATIAYFEAEEERFIQLVARGTGLSEEDVRKLYADPRHVFPDEAIELGLIDHILK